MVKSAKLEECTRIKKKNVLKLVYRAKKIEKFVKMKQQVKKGHITEGTKCQTIFYLYYQHCGGSKDF